MSASRTLATSSEIGLYKMPCDESLPGGLYSQRILYTVFFCDPMLLW